jgi:hypothetical protein
MYYTTTYYKIQIKIQCIVVSANTWFYQKSLEIAGITQALILTLKNRF